jgi:hypothetical protein
LGDRPGFGLLDKLWVLLHGRWCRLVGLAWRLEERALGRTLASCYVGFVVWSQTWTGNAVFLGTP